MTTRRSSRRKQRGSISVGAAIALVLFIVPMVGLAIDGTICYIVQTELAAACDGAALGTGRLLSTNANPTDIATEFLNANFRVGQAGFWSASNLTPTVTVQTGTTKTVTVAATVTVPLIFLQVFHQKTAIVSATATATRRDARIELVIDRSGSMNASDGSGSTVINDLVQYAQGFTQQFGEGYDELGLVAFSGSAVVGYPTSPWPAPVTANGAGGPDTSFLNGSSTDMFHQIGNIHAGGGTGMGDALAIAYLELQKAHMRDLAVNGADTKTNAIVLFTDGVPSSVATYLNRNTNHVISSGSGCTYQQDTAAPTHPMYGYVVQGSSSGNPPYSASWGFFQLASIDGSGNTSQWYMSNPTGDQVSPTPSTPETGCHSSGWNPLNNLSAIPSYDKYGYSLGPNGNGYTDSAFVNNPNGLSSIYNGTAFNTSNATSAYQWGLAAWDEVDQVANAIRGDTNYPNRAGDTTPMSITIFTVGYTGNGGTDYGLLQKVANVPGHTFYNSTQPAGLYIQASDKTALANAFSVIATAILRLAR